MSALRRHVSRARQRTGALRDIRPPDPHRGPPWAATEDERLAYADQIEREWGWEADMRQMCPNADEAMAQWWGERPARPRAPAPRAT